MAKATTFTRLNDLTKQHFDASAQSFLEELIQYHLNIDPEKIKPNQLNKIVYWLEIAAHLVNGDEKSVKSYIREVRKLSEVSRG